MSLTAEHRPVLSTVANTTRRTDGNDRNDALTVRTPLPPCGRVSPADAVEAAARRPVTSPGVWFASGRGPPAAGFCQEHGTTRFASYGTTCGLCQALRIKRSGEVGQVVIPGGFSGRGSRGAAGVAVGGGGAAGG